MLERSLQINHLLVGFISLIFCVQAFAHGDEPHANPVKKVVSDVFSNTELPRRLADGGLYVPKPIQRQLGLRTQIVKGDEYAASVELNGKVLADPGYSGWVQAIQSGVIVPPVNGLPILGQLVKKGQVLATLSPAGDVLERGNQQAQLAELDAQLSLANQRVARYEQLQGALPQKEIEASRVERNALQLRRDAVAASLQKNLKLIAPVSGVISASHVVAGQVVDAKDVLYEIVDQRRLMVEALGYDSELPAKIAAASGVSAQEGFALHFIGSGKQLREQALPLWFKVGSSESKLVVGQPIKIMINTKQKVSGVLIDRAALISNTAGEQQVWIHDEAERFLIRRVKTQTHNANQVLVTQGLHDGERVVNRGAQWLSEVR